MEDQKTPEIGSQWRCGSWKNLCIVTNFDKENIYLVTGELDINDFNEIIFRKVGLSIKRKDFWNLAYPSTGLPIPATKKENSHTREPVVLKQPAKEG